MRKIRVKVHADWGFVGTKREDVIEILVSDDATTEEVDKEAREEAIEWMWGFMDLGYDVQEGGQDETIN